MSKNKFSIHDTDIHISHPKWKQLGFTTYREDYYDELTSVTWSKELSNNGKNAYLKNKDLGYLHRYIMTKWYGEEVMEEMNKRNWIVDHMNNDGMDCRISNLEFLAKNFNTAKGQTFDISSKIMQEHLAVNIFKDMSTNNYQISIAFNDAIYEINSETGEKRFVNAIYLLYNSDYRMVILDAEHILMKYETENKFSFNGLSFIDKKIEYAPNYELTEKELYEIKNNGRCFIFRDGKPLLIVGAGVKVVSAAYKKGWGIPEE